MCARTMQTTRRNLEKMQIINLKNLQIAERTPVPPKKPLTPFFIWSSEVRDNFKKTHSELKTKELMDLIFFEWKQLSEKEKNKYNDAYEIKYQKYHQDFKAYVEKYGPIKYRKKDLDAIEKKSTKKFKF